MKRTSLAAHPTLPLTQITIDAPMAAAMPPKRRWAGPRRRARLVSTALALALLALWLGVGGAAAADSDDQIVNIAKQLKCPVCQNVPVAYSQSQLAGEMRQVIQDKLAQGESEEAIIQYFVDRYGEDVLLEPRREGFGLLLWVTSLGVILFGALVVGIVLWNWSQTRGAVTQSTPAGPASPKLEELFEEEFARYKQGRRT